MATANWGMEYLDNYLKGKSFTLYTDHKPLEKLSHLHTKTMNCLQENMLTYDFQIQYKKGATLSVDFLSRDVVNGLNEVVHSIDPFGLDLQELQKSDEQLIKINTFQKDCKWPLNTTKAKQKLLLPLTNSLFLDSKAAWIQLQDENYPRTVMVTQNLQKKGYLRRTWINFVQTQFIEKDSSQTNKCILLANIKNDIQAHIDSCLQCQVRRSFAEDLQPPQPQQLLIQPQQPVPIAPNPVARPSPQKPSRPLGSKNKFQATLFP